MEMLTLLQLDQRENLVVLDYLLLAKQKNVQP
jgi:hypothetical protein